MWMGLVFVCHRSRLWASMAGRVLHLSRALLYALQTSALEDCFECQVGSDPNTATESSRMYARRGQPKNHNVSQNEIENKNPRVAPVPHSSCTHVVQSEPASAPPLWPSFWLSQLRTAGQQQTQKAPGHRSSSSSTYQSAQWLTKLLFEGVNVSAPRIRRHQVGEDKHSSVVIAS